MEEIPTLLDISPTNCLDLDEADAVEKFLGKTQEEASQYMMELSEHVSEELMSMGIKAYKYYLTAIEPYLESEKSRGDLLIVSSLLGIISARAEHEDVTEYLEMIERILTYCKTHFEKFRDSDYDRSYRNLPRQLDTFLEFLNHVKTSSTPITWPDYRKKLKAERLRRFK